jgi:hypothetical protein
MTQTFAIRQPWNDKYACYHYFDVQSQTLWHPRAPSERCIVAFQADGTDVARREEWEALATEFSAKLVPVEQTAPGVWKDMSPDAGGPE